MHSDTRRLCRLLEMSKLTGHENIPPVHVELGGPVGMYLYCTCTVNI